MSQDRHNQSLREYFSIAMPAFAVQIVVHYVTAVLMGFTVYFAADPHIGEETKRGTVIALVGAMLYLEAKMGSRLKLWRWSRNKAVLLIQFAVFASLIALFILKLDSAGHDVAIGIGVAIGLGFFDGFLDWLWDEPGVREARIATGDLKGSSDSHATCTCKN